MNGRVRAIGSGLLVASTSLTVVGGAAAAAGLARSRAAETPAAIRTMSARASGAAPAGLPGLDPAVQARTDEVVVRKFTEAVAEQRRQEFVAAVAAAERARAAAPRRTTTTSSRSSGNVLDCIRHRESRGQYGVVNSSSGAAGAYQFMPGTWNNTARSAGRSDLVGVNPASASAADQDAMAQHLLSTQGLGPWGGSCG